jgi:hypothetical protein
MTVFSGLNDLTQVNQKLIAFYGQVDTENTPADTGLPVGDGSGETVGGERTEDPNETSEAKPPEYRSFSSANKFEFERVITALGTVIEMPSGTSTLVDAFLEEWALKWREEKGYLPTENIEETPTAQELLGSEEFMAGAAWLPFRTVLDTMPVAWTSELLATSEETGEEEVVPVIVVNDPLTGVNFIEETVIPQINLSVNQGSKSLGAKIRSAISSVVRQGDRETSLRIQEQLAQNPTTPGYISEFAAMRTRLERLAHVSDDDTPVAVSKGGIIPHISEEEFTAKLNTVTQSGGGGGGGGTTRRALEFDRNHLVSQVEDLWHSWMMEPGEAPMGTINGIVDEYIREAKAFWSGKGGQLDFNTYVRDKLKAQPRYKTVFKHKLPGTTEEAFLNEYLGRISQFGMGDQFNQEQGFAAVTSGAAPIEQAKRVSRTREVQNSGGFSQRLAQTIKGLGIT